ncbi:MAG: tRNA threonylcarbamoyl adenosine modification protein (Sua5/YciO/YrdC/YwlC family) [Cycloclasticus pugetii]|jgi:tRNA threonylcarbamoyl adenosine modification protein (Sua5/YciO/YrdC/YwlC family)|uniref:Translation factor YciO-like protein n=1 Tax=Cycloclasticus pugetii TaxID=34068 RepID=A0AB33Z545_9GAMM|nr:MULTISPECIES: L-threonylcarbamoyladenylate synthase [Cycloclasticus]AFT66776.1 putative translation factor YciO-like protein [Cycloclasticus sp. P1]ATI03594.1 threonylcarbamoyl-AMP synthase [Cycloclasticus sp. PY97N]EPD14081.1 translation factor YciO-like protein [Cycloclasticus pugetii]MDF1829113.1 L-threonylcarbamoyladenylate synthase [Cycloclasticus pugetii]PHR51999.1 MAG: threonylcarbamoyl-AMP synthase [Cycloclasticus sp.]|tara:strand:+ start:376 stop:1011 length:636 start_codon:yes stop_codon:yes gene_type:complete
MTQYLNIHPDNPQPRLIKQAADIIRRGGVIAYPTDSSYALACHLGDKQALDRIRQIRRIDDKHNFTLVCRDLTEISMYAQVNNDTYRLLKSLTPGAFTFVLKATKEVPRRLQHPKRKTVGIRIPNNLVAQKILEELNEPMLTSTLILPGETEAIADPYEINQQLARVLDLVVDAGVIPYEPTTMIVWDNDFPEVVREGKGIADFIARKDEH